MQKSLLKKKGFDINSEGLKLLILAVFLLIIMLYVTSSINRGAEKNADNNACKTSVIENSQARIMNLMGNEEWSSEIKCPVQEITIDESDDEKIMEQTAEAMYTCWDNFGKGELNIFPTVKGAQDVFCAICSEITYTKNDKSIPEFTQYLMDNNPPYSKDSYYKEFTARLPTEEETKELSANIYDVNSITIDTKNKYAVLFVYAKNVDPYDRMVKLARISGGVVLAGSVWALSGFFTGGTSWVLGIGFVTKVIVGGTVIGGSYGFFTGPSLKSDWHAGVQLVPRVQGVLDGLQCTKLGVKP
ncbi:MAG: hypothetical protein V1702_05830 [Candidatus Woesearchaeota archaeon]